MGRRDWGVTGQELGRGGFPRVCQIAETWGIAGIWEIAGKNTCL